MSNTTYACILVACTALNVGTDVWSVRTNNRLRDAIDVKLKEVHDFWKRVREVVDEN